MGYRQEKKEKDKKDKKSHATRGLQLLQHAREDGVWK